MSLHLTRSCSHITTAAELRNFYNVLWTAEFAPTIQILSLPLEFYREQVGNYQPQVVVIWDVMELNWRKYELDSLFSGVCEDRIKDIGESGDFDQVDLDPPPQSSILNFKSELVFFK